MKKNLTFLFIVALSFFAINETYAQCVPAATVPVAGTADANAGTSFAFTAVPTGNVITLISSGPDDVFTFDLCGNAPDNWPDGTADSRLAIIDVNAAGATELAAIDDGCTSNGAGPNYWGPSYGSWSPGAAGTFYLYLTEWDYYATYSNPCIADGVNSFDININIVVPGPCVAGTLLSPATQTLCFGDDFTLDLDGTQVSDGGFNLYFNNATTGGTGGPGVAFNQPGPWGPWLASEFPLTFDNTLNGLQATALSGTWEVTVQALDATGAVCAETTVTTVNFFDNPILYVDHTATGANDGSSWANAFTDLQAALAVPSGACPNDIYIAAGTYKPSAGGAGTRGIFFDVDDNQSLIGGFPNGGGDYNPVANVTILSGDSDGDGTWAGNAFHALKVTNSESYIVGLTIQDGNADAAGTFARERGGGVYAIGSTVQFSDVILTNNNAIYGGGVFATLCPVALFSGCTLNNNEADYGGAMYHSNETNMYIWESRIVDNNARVRVAIEINNSLYTYIRQSVIANNASTNANAIGFIATNRDQDCDIVNSTIIGETKNKRLVTLQIGFGDNLNVNCWNTIFAHQTSTFDKNFVAFNNNTYTFNLTNCYIQGSTSIGTLTNSIYQATAGDLILNADYSLSQCSPGVNAGDNAIVSAIGITEDIAGNARTFGTTVDMGAYEAQTTCTLRETQEELTETVDIKVSPNPATDVLNIRTQLENVTVSIVDILGKEVLVSQENEINVSRLAHGTYFVNFYQNGEFLSAEKLIIK